LLTIGNILQMLHYNSSKMLLNITKYAIAAYVRPTKEDQKKKN